MVTIFAYLVARCCYIIHLCPDFVLTPSTEIELRFLSGLLACLMRTYAALFALLLLIHMKNCFPTMLIFFRIWYWIYVIMKHVIIIIGSYCS
jgi:uncharacterized membrane protein YesL